MTARRKDKGQPGNGGRFTEDKKPRPMRAGDLGGSGPMPDGLRARIVWDDFVNHLDGDERRARLQTTTDATILDAAAGFGDAGDRSAVAGNPNTPVAVLHGLADDSNLSVQLSVADSPSTPVDLLDHMYRDYDGLARPAAGRELQRRGLALPAMVKDPRTGDWLPSFNEVRGTAVLSQTSDSGPSDAASRVYREPRYGRTTIVQMPDGRKVKLHVSVDRIYQWQSRAEASVWDGERWNAVHSIPMSDQPNDPQEEEGFTAGLERELFDTVTLVTQ